MAPLNVLRLRLWVHESAYRHGFTDEDILHGWDNAMAFHDIDIEHEPTKSLCIGPDRAGNLLEVLFLQGDDADLIIHVMPLRPAFHGYLI